MLRAASKTLSCYEDMPSSLCDLTYEGVSLLADCRNDFRPSGWQSDACASHLFWVSKGHVCGMEKYAPKIAVLSEMMTRCEGREVCEVNREFSTATPEPSSPLLAQLSLPFFFFLLIALRFLRRPGEIPPSGRCPISVARPFPRGCPISVAKPFPRGCPISVASPVICVSFSPLLVLTCWQLSCKS